MSKHRLIVVALACAMVAACVAVPPPAPVSPGESARAEPTAVPRAGKLRLAFVSPLDLRELPLLIALGDLEAQGYTVEKIGLANTSLVVEALVRGDADLAAANNQTTWAAIAKGAELRSIVQRSRSTISVVTRQELKTCADLGKLSVASSAPSNIVPTLLNLYVKQHCPGTELDFLVISDQNSRVAALVAGAADAAILDAEYLLAVERQAPGRFHVLIPLAQEYPQVEHNSIQARTAWLREQPDAARALLRAFLTANRRISANPDVLVEEAVKRLEMDPAVAREVGEVLLRASLWDPNGGPTRESVQSTLDILAGAGTLPASLKVDDVADLSYLNTVLDEIGRK
jgi:ABC-type nitrate/sulfonate/bicarbonate transport system substrate-binding protein